jgi:hypothetical protein
MKITMKAVLCILRDAKGDVRTAVVNDTSDNVTIGGYDLDGKYHQYDSYEAYHVYGWAIERGFYFTTKPFEIDVHDIVLPQMFNVGDIVHHLNFTECEAIVVGYLSTESTYFIELAVNNGAKYGRIEAKENELTLIRKGQLCQTS